MATCYFNKLYLKRKWFDYLPYYLNFLAKKDDGKVHVEEKSPDCIYCSDDHILDRCNAFMNQTLKESINFLAKKKKRLVVMEINHKLIKRKLKVTL